MAGRQSPLPSTSLCSRRQRGQVFQLLFPLARPELVPGSVPRGGRPGQGRGFPILCDSSGGDDPPDPPPHAGREADLLDAGADCPKLVSRQAQFSLPRGQFRGEYERVRGGFRKLRGGRISSTSGRWPAGITSRSCVAGSPSSRASRSTSTSTSRLPTTRASCCGTSLPFSAWPLTPISRPSPTRRRSSRGLPGELSPSLRRCLQQLHGDRTRELASFLREQFGLSLPSEWEANLSSAGDVPEEAATPGLRRGAADGVPPRIRGSRTWPRCSNEANRSLPLR